MDVFVTSAIYDEFWKEYRATVPQLLRYGQAFVNFLKKHFPDQQILNPELFYEMSDSRAENLILSQYLRESVFVGRLLRMYPTSDDRELIEAQIQSLVDEAKANDEVLIISNDFFGTQVYKYAKQVGAPMVMFHHGKKYTNPGIPTKVYPDRKSCHDAIIQWSTAIVINGKKFNVASNK